MGVLVKNLGTGTLNSLTAQTPGPAVGKSWIVKSVIITNRDAASRTLDLKVVNGVGLNGSGTATGYIAPPNMAVAAGTTAVVDNEITLQYPSGGTQQTLSIGATGTTPTAVDIVINGIERDL